ncbi:hypothetical protein TYRP_017186 [Tyrophagus putrescentiae]|nr:hypothetical protein TYRP_017186 [Tyrophagus putrescentiae]
MLAISFSKALADSFDPAKHLASIDDLHALLATRGGNQINGITTSRQRFQSRYRSRKDGSSSDKRYNRDGPMCWYHFRFGKKAQKCNKKGCPLRKKGNDNQ